MKKISIGGGTFAATAVAILRATGRREIVGGRSGSVCSQWSEGGNLRRVKNWAEDGNPIGTALTGGRTRSRTGLPAAGSMGSRILALLAPASNKEQI